MSQTDDASKYKLTPTQLRFAARLNFIVFPVDINELADNLQLLGYQRIGKREPTANASAISGLRFVPVNEFFRKDDLMVDIDTERQILGVSGNDISKVLESYREIEGVLKDKMNVDLRTETRFYEVLAGFEVQTGNNPRTKIGGAPTLEGFSKLIGGVVGMDLSPFTVRLALGNALPSQEDWFEITVEPWIPKATTTYYVSTVYRNKDRENMAAFSASLENKIRGVVEAIESRS
jgi:hypothetical protein